MNVNDVFVLPVLQLLAGLFMFSIGLRLVRSVLAWAFEDGSPSSEEGEL